MKRQKKSNDEHNHTWFTVMLLFVLLLTAMLLHFLIRIWK